MRLREHARRLIAETRARSHNLDSPTSPIRMITQRITLSPERSTISPITASADGAFFADERPPAKTTTSGGSSAATKENSSPAKRLSGHLQRTAGRQSDDIVEDATASRRASPARGLLERNGNTPPLMEQQQLQRASPLREKKVSSLNRG